MKSNYLYMLAVMVFVSSCTQETDSLQEIVQPSEVFAKTWYAGKAELSSFTLEQARYGEIRNGEAVLIFVTEDFSTNKLVKLDEPEKVSEKIKVLKMNMTKKFVTGVYPYSMMLSVFTPVTKDGNVKTLKIDCSSQEWCGHTFSQLRLHGGNYDWQLHSYFEKESEQDKNLGADILEDELWNRIRLNPSTLPTGKIFVIPGLIWQRLSHIELKAEDAELSLSKADTLFIKDKNVQMFSIHYTGAKRTLQIYFQGSFPHEILGWQETYPDGFGDNKKMLTTKAHLKKQIWLDYWKHNTIADSSYLDSLQLMRYER